MLNSTRIDSWNQRECATHLPSTSKIAPPLEMYSSYYSSITNTTELTLLPPHWRLVPVCGKQPLGRKWQNHAYSPQQMLGLLEQSRVSIWGKNGTYTVHPTGYGLLCGATRKEYLIAVDCDGYHAHQKFWEILKYQQPATVAFTSGRSWRCQYLLSLPGFPGKLKSRKIPCLGGETLELRGERHVSVLPPSPHPTTGQYKWIEGYRPDQIGVARAPEGILQLMQPVEQVKQETSRRKIHHFVPPSPRHLGTPSPRHLGTPSRHRPTTTTLAQARSLVQQIHPRFADEYYSWLFVGMALKSIDWSLLWEWDRWSAQSPKYKPGEPQYKWGTFQGTGITERYLWWLAQQI
jgi:hypothetical protein